MDQGPLLEIPRELRFEDYTVAWPHARHMLTSVLSLLCPTVLYFGVRVSSKNGVGPDVRRLSPFLGNLT